MKHILISLLSLLCAYQSYSIALPKVYINEVVTDPQQDWSSVAFEKGSSPGGSAGTNDEWIELYIAETGLDLTLWTIELNDGTDVSGDLSNTGAFDVVNYISNSGGSLSSTQLGDYIILGNVDGSGAMNNTGITIVLKDENEDVVDQVTLGGEMGEAPSGYATTLGDEVVARVLNGVDTNIDNVDFIEAQATIGEANHFKKASRVRGNSVEFDGRGDYLKLNDLAVYDLASFTMSAWVKITESSNGGIVFTKKASASKMNYGLGITSLGYAYATFHDDDGIEYTSTGITSIEDDEWHFVVGTFDAPTKELKIYVDGFLENLSNPSATPTTGISDLYVGAESSVLSMLEGEVDEMSLWNKVLSQTEIRNQRHLTYSGKEDGLILYLQFNEYSGNAIDVMLGNEAVFNGDSKRIRSGANVADGISTFHTINALGTYSSNSTISDNDRLQLTFNSVYPNGELVVTYLPDTPVGGLVDESTNNSGGIWLVNNYGSVQTGLSAEVEFWYPDGNISSTDLASYKLYKKPSNGEGDWVKNNDFANSVSTVSGNNYVKFEGVDEFSQFVMTSTISLLTPIVPLAIELANFKGNNIDESIQLSWETLTEKDNDYFVVERSVNAFSFTEIGRVKGAGNSFEPQSYEFTDVFPLTGISYYRLKSVDYEGKEEVSELIAIYNEEQFSLAVKPNPFTTSLTISVSSEKKERLETVLYDRYGNVVATELFHPNQFSEERVLNTTHFPTGVYLLKLLFNNQVYTYKLLKK